MYKKHHQYRNQIRIIGGLHRGRKLHFPVVAGLRPTADSVRERLFNWLGQDLSGCDVLDLFAGSGAMGLEAASRQANTVVLIDNNKTVVTALQNSIAQLQLAQVDLMYTDAVTYLQSTMAQFDVVFLDPPYAWQESQWSNLLMHLIAHLKPGAQVYLEAQKMPFLSDDWHIQKQGKAGISQFRLLTYQRNDGEQIK